MEIISDIKDMQARCLAARAAGQTIAFVPTMGYLHAGHLSLLEKGRRCGDLLVLSIFVNPTQFGPNEDLDKYPRDFARDEALARQAGVDLIFYPTPDTMYPANYSSYVSVEGDLTGVLEGSSRPCHFRGVTTVVTKLFNIVQPHLALFGQKDFQQLAVIQRMTADLNLPVKVIGMPIVREADGLAMSSRNVYLSLEERKQALALVDSLQNASKMAREGERDAVKIQSAVKERLLLEPALKLDYAKICNAQTLEVVERVDRDAVLLLAVKVGNTRLIDNGYLLA